MLTALNTVLLIPLFYAIYIGDNAFAFMLPIVIGFLLATAAALFAQEPKVSFTIKESILATVLTWLLASLMAAVPFLAVPTIPLVDCFFEATSGITGTGATVLLDVESLPKSINLWRHLTHWIGGIGIVVIFIVLIPQVGQSSSQLFFAESSGPTDDKMLPRLKNTARLLIGVYLTISLVAVLTLYLLGMSLFDAVCIGLSAISTGGFAVLNESIGGYHNLAIELAVMIFMLLGATSFTLYFVLYRKGIREVLQNTEYRVFLLCFTVGAILVGTNLSFSGTNGFRESFFAASSIITSTCFSTVDFDSFPTFSKIILLLLAIIGGCAGSTAGGIKVVRLVILLKMTRNYILTKINPRNIYVVKINGKEIKRNTVYQVARFFFIYISLAFSLAFILTMDGLGFIDGLVAGFSLIGNSGIGYGTIAGSFSQLSPLAKFLGAIYMIMGRLEIFPVLVLLRRDFWHSGKW